MKSLFCIGVILPLLLCSSVALAGRVYKEKAYQTAWCSTAGGVAEYTLYDRTRVDCVTEEYAVEVDFAPRWAQAIGQALYYAQMTNRKPGVVIIIEKESDLRFLKRMNLVAEELGIRVWTITPDDLTGGRVKVKY